MELPPQCSMAKPTYRIEQNRVSGLSQSMLCQLAYAENKVLPRGLPRACAEARPLTKCRLK